MSMSKKDFIALADVIITHNRNKVTFNPAAIDALADFCLSQNSKFMRGRWLGYIAGENGKGGGKLKA
jgi:hypothetical protein